jgi:hypothetical protein
MPLTGIEKSKHNVVSYRIAQQKEFWPSVVKELDEKSNGVRFRSEILSYTDLFNIYMYGIGDDITPEDESRGRKKSKVDRLSEVIPAKAFELPGRFSDKTEYHTGQWGYLNFDQWLYARDQARKDLYFLCKEVFDMDVQPHVHKVICDQFVMKNFDGVYKEGYRLKEDFQAALGRQSRVPHVWVQTSEYEPRTLGDFGHYIPDPVEAEKFTNYARTMVLLEPRGHFKSTIDAADAIQWIINCPDIRILIVAGIKKLGEQFLAAVKQGPKQPSFYLPKGISPSTFQLLFPEFVVRGVDGTSNEPLRVGESCAGRIYKISKFFSPDPTIGVISVGSSLSGFHCDVLKCDDIVTDENCNTNETREAILLKADGAVNMLMPWGWHDIIGTRYFPDDYYGLTEKAHLENPETFNLKYFCRAAWTVKEEYKHIEEKSIYDLTEEMVDLTFPELAGSPHATWLDLQKKLRKNERSFRTQQLNQPVWGELNSINFERGLLETQRSKTFAEVMAAKPDYIYGAIDLAKENKQYSDFTALAVGKICQEDTSRNMPLSQNNFSVETEESRWVLVILDVEFGKWTQTEIANRIAKMNDKWRPKAWHGEDPGGLELLKERINEVSKVTYGHWPYIRWMPPENSENAKRNRIKGLELLFRNKRLYFLTAPWNNEVFEQLEKYKGQKSSRYFKDDVPDAISQLTRFIPSLVILSKKDLEQQAIQKEAEYREYLRREMRRVIFGDDSGGFVSPVNTEQPVEESKPVSSISRKYFGNTGLRF